MNRVVFEIPDGLTVVEGVCAVVCFTREGKRVLQLSRVGEPALWSQIGLLEAGADRARERLKEAWN